MHNAQKEKTKYKIMVKGQVFVLIKQKVIHKHKSLFYGIKELCTELSTLSTDFAVV